MMLSEGISSLQMFAGAKLATFRLIPERSNAGRRNREMRLPNVLTTSLRFETEDGIRVRTTEKQVPDNMAYTEHRVCSKQSPLHKRLPRRSKFPSVLQRIIVTSARIAKDTGCAFVYHLLGSGGYLSTCSQQFMHPRSCRHAARLCKLPLC